MVAVFYFLETHYPGLGFDVEKGSGLGATLGMTPVCNLGYFLFGESPVIQPLVIQIPFERNKICCFRPADLFET